MKRILMSLGAIVFVGAVAWGATGAFFTDSQTSTGNTFSAGGISLQVDSTQHYNNAICVADNAGPGHHWVLAANQTAQPDQYPVIGSACTGTWAPTTLGPTNQFFSFLDVKPQDMGENTISLHNLDNSAWACMDVSLTNNSNSTTTPGFTGNLANNIQVFLWQDNGSTTVAATTSTAGDNIYVPGSGDTPITASPVSLASLFNGNVNGPATTTIALADSSTGGPLGSAGGSNIGFAWCAGTMTVGANGAISCNGASMGNSSEFNSLSADITLRLSQSRNQPTFTCGAGTVAGPQTIVVGAADLDAGPKATAVTDNSGKWFMYEDNSDTINNSLGSFVAGPSTPPAGTGSVQFTLGAPSVTDRDDIATFAYQGTLLSSISTLAYSAYSHAGSGGAGVTESPYLVFDVDFSTTSTALYSGRLVYVPSANGAVPQNAWNTFNTINGGTGLWTWSGLAKGADKTASTADDNKWPDGNPNQYRTWASIVAAFPNAKISSVAGLLGVRVGEPGPTGYIGNIDKFQINTGSGLKTYDFGN